MMPKPMRSSLSLAVAIMFLVVAAPPGEAQTAGVQAADTDFSIPADERPFWENAQAFVDAYTARDAEAIGQLFTEDAEFFDEFGERTTGRAGIVAMFDDVFATSPDAVVESIDLQQVRHVTSDVALEEGVTHSRATPGNPRESSRYVALHVKGADGVWRIHTLKSFGQQAGERSEQLNQLVWMTGDWTNEGGNLVVHSSCRWSDDGNYLLRQFNVLREGEPVMSGVQRIGWDPLRRQIRSWTFDSDGGFTEGTWVPNGNEWVVKSSGVTSEGEPASGTAVYTIIDAEMITWRFRDLIVGGDVREDVEPVVMVRRSPQPATSVSN